MAYGSFSRPLFRVILSRGSKGLSTTERYAEAKNLAATWTVQRCLKREHSRFFVAGAPTKEQIAWTWVINKGVAVCAPPDESGSLGGLRPPTRASSRSERTYVGRALLAQAMLWSAPEAPQVPNPFGTASGNISLLSGSTTGAACCAPADGQGCFFLFEQRHALWSYSE